MTRDDSVLTFPGYSLLQSPEIIRT